MGKINCERCKHRCRGDVLRVSNKYFHKDCFTCTKCNKNLEHGGFYVKDGGFYCQEDYQKSFIDKCKICSKDLIGEIVTALSYSFHRECFKCSFCSASFFPGDRVTVWKDKFFCSKCIKEVPVSTSLQTSGQNSDQVDKRSSFSVTDDEGCVSTSDRMSPGVTINEEAKSSKISPSKVPCVSSSGLPQQSKSILRKSATEKFGPQASHAHGYLSTDSGLGDRLFDSKNVDEPSPTDAVSYQQTDNSKLTSTRMKSQTLSFHLSRQSLSGRVPNSDYGRCLNQSYIHLDLTKSVVPDNDRYKRNVSYSILNTFKTQPKQFHVPEGKSRFPAPGVKTYSTLFGRSMSTALPTSYTESSHMNGTTPIARPSPSKRFTTSSATNLTQQSTRNLIHQPFEDETKRSQPNLPNHGDEEITMEARKLACYPAGQKRDQTVPPPIDRYDWPAPAASAVVLAELMRERRQRKREQARLSYAQLDGDDVESQDALSIDYSFDGHLDSVDNINRLPGIGLAILRETAEHKQKARSQNFLDPVSASRTPSAAVEPSFKPRYATHQFASPSRDRLHNPSKCHHALGYSMEYLYLGNRRWTIPRPEQLINRDTQLHDGDTSRPINTLPMNAKPGIRSGYTDGHLSVNMKTASLPATSMQSNQIKVNGHLSSLQTDQPHSLENGKFSSPGDSTCNVSFTNGLSQGKEHASNTINTIKQNPNFQTGNPYSSSNRSIVVDQSLTDQDEIITINQSSSANYSNLFLLTSSPTNAFRKLTYSAPKIIPYAELKARKGALPKGLDPTALETHLSDQEFQQVFFLTRQAFYRLPEWKRNDLKRRVELF